MIISSAMGYFSTGLRTIRPALSVPGEKFKSPKQILRKKEGEGHPKLQDRRSGAVQASVEEETPHLAIQSGTAACRPPRRRAVVETGSDSVEQNLPKMEAAALQHRQPTPWDTTPKAASTTWPPWRTPKQGRHPTPGHGRE
ncbi:hypothetical protein LIER_03906 [Lithospermum erythrorhizon]|uniref:Uncharacterized protein n=1 Tax=Lithospermum erythrorhizon TaxID=34254 RepID=A0AAV3NUT7_LITER